MKYAVLKDITAYEGVITDRSKQLAFHNCQIWKYEGRLIPSRNHD